MVSNRRKAEFKEFLAQIIADVRLTWQEKIDAIADRWEDDCEFDEDSND